MKKPFFIVLLIVFINQISYSQRNNFIENSGDLLQIGLPTLAFISTFVWKDDSKPEWQFVKAMGTSFLITHSLKRIINKKRPNGGKYSFPSGHTSAAFTGAAFIEKRYGWKAGISAYLLASYVGYSRIYAKKHDIYDVIGGATVGIISAYLFTKEYSKNLKLTFNNTNYNEFIVGINYSF